MKIRMQQPVKVIVEHNLRDSIIELLKNEEPDYLLEKVEKLLEI